MARARARLAAVLFGGFLGLLVAAGEPPPNAPPAPQPESPPRWNKSSKKDKDLHWSFKWEAWGGLRYEVRKSLAGEDPFKNVDYLDLSHVKLSGKFGWRLNLDAASLGGLAQPGADDWEVRRAAVYWAGDFVFLAPFSYRLDLSAVGGHLTAEDTYVRWEHLPWIGGLKLGQYDAPFGLENSCTSFSKTFMESAAPVSALAPGRNLGIQVGHPFAGSRMTWALGAFRAPSYQDSGDASKNYMRIVGRITGLAVDRPDPDRPEFLHLGLSLSNLDSSHYGVEYKSRPESHLAPYLVDTGHFPEGKSEQLGLEAAWVDGPVSIQGEYLASKVHRRTGSPVQFGGFYCQGTLSLTGESRPYDRQEGVLRSLVPHHPLSFKRGNWGALELAARFSHLDLNDGEVRGGLMNTVTLGANWYWSAHAKVILNYVRGSVSGPTPYKTINILEFRIAFNI
jgi:phosphate-selective porin OprO and OprP